MAGTSNRSPETIKLGQLFERGRDVSDFSKDELLAHIDALEMEISGKDGIIQSLQGDLSVSTEQIMNIPPGYRLRLENTVTEQNLTIEALREELEQKQREFQKLTNELFSLKADASHEISELKGDTERKKTRWKEEKTTLENCLKDMIEAFEKKTAVLDCSLNSEVDKNYILEKQVELLSNRIEELYQRGVDHDEEFEVILKHWEDEMNEMRKSCQPLDHSQDGQKVSPEIVDSLKRQLAECLAKNAELSALVKSSERVRHSVREELQHNLQSALDKIEVVTSNLRETEKRKADLEEMCRTHDVELCRLKENLTKNFNTDLLTLKKAFRHLHKLIGYFSLSSSQADEEMFPDLESSNEDEVACVTGDIMDSLLDKIDKCSLAIEKHYDSFTELVCENEGLSKQNELLRQNAEEVDRYKEGIVHLKSELDKIRQHYELLGKNNDNVIMTFKKDLEVSKDNYYALQTEKNGIIKRLTEDLTVSKRRSDELEKKYRQLKHLLSTKHVVGVEDDDCDELGEQPVLGIGHNESQCDLQQLQYSCPKCSESACLESGHLSPISKFGLPSDVTPPKAQAFQKFTTSTPFPTHLKGGGESAVPEPVLDASQYQLALIRWMETCRDLNSENGDLKNEISELKMQVKDLELSACGIREEMQVFDLKRKDLEIKLSDYANLKHKSCQLAERLKLNDLKMSGMEKDLELFARQNKLLTEENMQFEAKFKELLAASENKSGERTLNISESLFNDLSNKVNEIILLKGQISTLLHAKRTLEERNTNLEEVRNLYVLKLEEATRELTNCRNEIEILIQSNIKLSTANRSFEKEVRMLKIRVEHLTGLREQNWGRTEQNLLAETMQKDILTICKETIDKKFEYDKLLSGGKKVDNREDDFDARHRMELLIKENGQLAHEKETLLLTIAEQQKLIHDFQKGSGCDEGWMKHLEETETDLLKELRDHKEQHARIEEALRSTGSLHNELQKEKDEMKFKMIELAKLEKKYQTEKLKAQHLEIESKRLKQEVIDKRELMKILENEKQELCDHLSVVKSALENTQEKLEFEIQCNRVRLKHVELQNTNNEMLENFLSSSQEEKPFFDTDVKYHQKVRQEVEAQYTQALQRMKHYLTAEFALKAQEEQSNHVNQLKHFKTIIREQAEAIEKLASTQIIKELTGGDNDTPEYRVLLENMGKCKAEIETATSAIGNHDDATRVKKAFQDYFNYLLLLAQKLLQDEHRAQYALSVSTWEHLHESELKLVKLQLQAAQYKDKLCDLNEVSHKEDTTSDHEIFPDEDRNLTASQYIFHFLLKSYFSHVEKYTGSWCSALQKEIKTIDVEMRKKEMINYGNQIEKNLKERDFAKEELLIAKGDGLVKAAKGFIESIQGFKRELLSGLTQALDSVFDATKNTLQDFKKENSQLDKLLSLEEEVVKLKREKEEAEKQYNTALQLLKSDHDSEVKKLESILLELKHLSEIGCRADALLKLKDELEEKHKKEAEEMRTWFERKVADLEKNFSEEVFSQHSRKMSSSSSCLDDDLDRDKFTAPSEFQCETGNQHDSVHEMVDLSDLFPSSENKGILGKGSRKAAKSNRCSDCVSCAAKVLSRFILDESHQEVEHELMKAVNKQEIEGLRALSNRESRLFTQGIADWELEERGSTIVTKTIDKIGVECFKSLKEHLENNILEQLKSFDSTIVDKMSKIGRMLDSECKKLNKLDSKIAAFSESRSEKLAEETKPSSNSDDLNEVGRLLKDRDDLGKIKKTLKVLVSEMSQYLSDSENELIRQIKGEIVKLCPEAVEVSDTVNTDAPNTGKHVHFGSNLSSIIQELDVTINSESVLDWTHDSSTRFRADVHSCIRKLKLEAAALYTLSHQGNVTEMDSNKVESQIEALRKENMALIQEMNQLKMTSHSHLDITDQSLVSFCTELEAVYGDVGDPQTNSSLPDAHYLLNKARKHLLNVKELSATKALEHILREGDCVIDELQIRCDDLEQQVEVADKQLRSTRQFLEEQAVERESERDEYNREVSSLQTLLKEKDKECSLKERFNSEVLASEAKNAPPSSKKVEELNKELKETVDRLNESLNKERLLQGELKAAIDQVWVLRDIIRNLESQVLAKTEKEAELENKIEQLEHELDERNGAQSVMAHEIETLRNQSLEESRGFEQLQELEENIKLRFNSSVIRQFQAQIREMGKTLDTQTKELEGNNVGVSSNSLSSPSEEISIREHLEFFNRSKTPEHCPSPVSLPVDEVNKLNEKIIRHARADEVILKKLRDQEIRIVKMTNFAEEMQAERDILHEHVEKLKTQIADANNKIDFLRHKADASNAAANRDIINENQKLKDSLSEAEQTLNKLNHLLLEKESQLENAEEVITVQQDKLRSLVQCDENALESLRLEVAAVIAEKNKLEGLVEKYRSDLEKYGTHPSELKALLADKNEDIELLQDTIARYQNETERSSKSSSKGLRVSFAADAESPDVSHESRLRDYPQNDSFRFDDPSHPIPLKSSTHRDIEVSVLHHPTIEPVLDASLGKKNADDVRASGALDKLRLQLMEKDQHISKLGEQLAGFKKIEKDLLKTKTQLEATVAAISEDKKYYEEQLTSLFDEIKTKDEKCCSLEKLLSQKGTEIIKLSADLQTVQNLVAITQEKLNEAQILAQQEIAGSETHQVKVSFLQKENSRLESENSTLLDNLSRVKLDNESLGSQIQNLILENETLQGKLSEIIVLKDIAADKCSKIESLKTSLENQFEEMKIENQNLKSQLTEFESVERHFEKTQEHLTSVLSEYESLQTTLNNMRVAYERQSFETEQLKVTSAKASGLQNEVASLLKEVDRLGIALKTEQNIKNGLQKRLGELSNSLESFKNENGALSEEKNNLLVSNKEMKKELDNFRTSVKNLRDDLSSLKNKEGPYISLLSSIDCNDVKKLYLEVSKLISDVGQLEFQRNCLQQELAKMKFASAEVVLRESELDKLGEQISRLENINAELKANNYQNTEQLRTEIMKLSQDIQFLQTIEQQANEKLTASLTDNKNLGSKLSKMEKELNQVLSIRKTTSEKGLQISVSPNLSRTATESFEHLPGTNERRELLDSRHVESSHFQPSIITRDVGCQCGRRYQNSSLEVVLFEKMKLIDDLKGRLHAEESNSRSLRAEKLDAELNLKTLEKINRLQEKKLEIISSEMRQMSNDRLQLELDVHNEKTSRLHAENELNTERMKTQSIQMENINMMENMRARLKLAMENEAKLKTMVVEKHEECERVVARLNSVMVMERYRSDSENDGFSSTPKKRLAEIQETCRALGFELEKQGRINADLNAVLARERRSLASVQEQLKSLEGENDKLKTDLNNEIIKREILQDQLHEQMSANERSASTDSDRVQPLQREIERLREKVEILRELNEQWRASSYTPALDQLNELNSNVDSLANKKRELQSSINDLERERNFLGSQISKLREERTNMRLSSEKMDFAPSVSAKLDIYLGRYFRAESYRKSLVTQKKYLMALLSGFDSSHQKTLSVLASDYKKTRRRPSFKGVVQTVVAISRMKFFVRKRKLACEAAYMGVLRTLGFTSEDALNRATAFQASLFCASHSTFSTHPPALRSLAAAPLTTTHRVPEQQNITSTAQQEAKPPSHMIYSNSPPTKEYPKSEGARRLKVQTASHSEYLAALQEVQKLTRKT